MTSGSDRTPIVIDTFWDGDAGVWVAAARDDLGVVTEAETLDALRFRLALILPDFLESADAVAFELVLGQVPDQPR